MRIVVALGGNAMSGPDGASLPQDQQVAIELAAGHIAELVAAGHDVVVTHGNGPQVGNILLKNELSAHLLAPVPLDWCGAQTQGTLGFTLVNALERGLAAHGDHRDVVALVTRTLVDPDDPAMSTPTKAIGPYASAERAARGTADGQAWRDEGERGWRRIVGSPEPQDILEGAAIAALVSSGFLVIAAGGGGIPCAPDSRGGYRGIEAVIDKDLSATLLARAIDADTLIIATDVEHAVLGWGTDDERPIGRVTTGDMRRYLDAGHFGVGSMLPKMEAVTRFVESGGRRAVVTSLANIAAAVDRDVGTVILPT